MKLIELGVVRLEDDNLFYPIILDVENKRLYRLIDYYSEFNYPKSEEVTTSIELEELDERGSNYIADLFEFLLEYHMKRSSGKYKPNMC